MKEQCSRRARCMRGLCTGLGDPFLPEFKEGEPQKGRGFLGRRGGSIPPATCCQKEGKDNRGLPVPLTGGVSTGSQWWVEVYQ